MSLDRGWGRVRIAITFGDQAEHERRDNEYGYSSFCRSEAKSLPHFVELETPDFLSQIANSSTLQLKAIT
jgi:hypothetical protein